MLGRKICPTNEPTKAVEYFQRVRPNWPAAAFTTPLGWPSRASVGRRRCISNKRSSRGHWNFICNNMPPATFQRRTPCVGLPEAALKSDPATLQMLATGGNSSAQSASSPRMFLVFVSRGEDDAYADNTSSFNPWLDALEKADVHDVEDAEQLALAAYQNNKMEMAQRWINPRSLKARRLLQWLASQTICARRRKPTRAAAILQHLSALFPDFTRYQQNPLIRVLNPVFYMDFPPQ